MTLQQYQIKEPYPTHEFMKLKKTRQTSNAVTMLLSAKVHEGKIKVQSILPSIPHKKIRNKDSTITKTAIPEQQ